VGLPVRIVSPGEIIQAGMRARGWTQRDLAEILERSARVVSEIVNARREITPEMAGELAAVFGTSARFWLDLEDNYRLHLARREWGTEGAPVSTTHAPTRSASCGLVGGS